MHNVTTKYKETKVWSATKFDLILAIIFIILDILMEGLILYNIFTNEIGVAFILQILVAPLLCLLMANYIGAYKRRSEFVLYFSRIEDVINFTKLKCEYYLCKIDDYGVVFINKEDKKLYSDWWSSSYNQSTYDIEEKYFKNSTISFITKGES